MERNGCFVGLGPYSMICAWTGRSSGGVSAVAVHRLFGLDHACGDQVDLAADKVGLLAVDGHLAEGMDAVFQLVQLQLDQLQVVHGLLEIDEPFLRRGEVVLQRFADPLLLQCLRIRRQLGQPLLDPPDVLLDRFAVGLLQKAAEGEMRVQKP